MRPDSLLKADLHVHSFFSGYTGSLPIFRSRDCYSTPEEIYFRAKARGMDLVTITDHDSIDGCLEFLERHPESPDFIIGEEIGCGFPDLPLTVHVGALGIDERIHRELVHLRKNVFDVVNYLRSEKVMFTLHHLFHFFRDQMNLRRYVEELLPLFPAVEVRNGMMSRSQNEFISSILASFAKQGLHQAHTGGSDAHVLTRIGTTYTRVPGRNREEFIRNLRRGEAIGLHGSTTVMAREIYGVIFNYWGSLLGYRRNELGRRERIRSIGLSLLSLPFQFTPLMVALKEKLIETARINGWQREWEGVSK